MSCTTVTPPDNVFTVVIECVQPASGGGFNWGYVLAATIAAIALGLTTFFTLKANRTSNEKTLERQRELAEDNLEQERTLAHQERTWDKSVDAYVELVKRIRAGSKFGQADFWADRTPPDFTPHFDFVE